MSHYYPSEICLECGYKHGRPRHNKDVGMWTGKCGWCGTEGSVCSPRDFLFPDWDGTPPDGWLDYSSGIGNMVP